MTGDKDDKLIITKTPPSQRSVDEWERLIREARKQGYSAGWDDGYRDGLADGAEAQI